MIDLVEKFPTVFELSKNGELGFFAGASYPEGWEAMVYSFCEWFSHYKEHRPDKNELYIQQIKEKFGGLRIYPSLYDKEVENVISFLEFQSFNTCEVTGKLGVLCIKNGWVKVLSEEARNMEDYKGYEPQ